MPIKHPKHRKPSAKPTRHVEHTRGLVLDDFLTVTDKFRRVFQLPVPQFGVKEMEEYPGATEAFEMLIQSTIDRHGTEICATRHPLLSDIGTDVYLEPFVSEVSSGWRISPRRIPKLLEKLLEISLQTVSQLPQKDPKPEYNPKQLRQLAARLRKLGEEADTLLHKREAVAHIHAYFGKKTAADEARLLHIAKEMRWAADALAATTTHIRLVRPKMDSPNPQVRLALYIVGWFEKSTGQEQYAPLETLVNSAFSAAGKEAPKWVGRLAIEMHLHRQRRRRYALTLR